MHLCESACLGGHAWVMQDSETPASPVIDFSVPQLWPYHTKLRDKCPVPAAIAFLKLRPRGHTNAEVKPENGLWQHIKD